MPSVSDLLFFCLGRSKMSNVRYPNLSPEPEEALPINSLRNEGSSAVPILPRPVSASDLSNDSILLRFDLQTKMMNLLLEETESLRKTVSLQGALLQDALNTSEMNRRRCEELEKALKHALHLNNCCNCNSRTYHLS